MLEVSHVIEGSNLECLPTILKCLRGYSQGHPAVDWRLDADANRWKMTAGWLPIDDFNRALKAAKDAKTPVEVTPRRIPPQLERRQEEMRARNMGAALPPTTKPAKNLSPLQKKLAENVYSPEELSALGPSAETIRRLFKKETKGVDRLLGPSGKYDTMWISESAVFRVLGANFFSAPKHKSGTRFKRRVS